MSFNKQQIIEQICEILNKKLNVNKELLIEENFNQLLTGFKFGLNSTRLTYFFLEIEKVFNIKIDTSKIMNYEFNTINGVAKIVEVSLI